MRYEALTQPAQDAAPFSPAACDWPQQGSRTSRFEAGQMPKQKAPVFFQAERPEQADDSWDRRIPGTGNLLYQSVALLD